MIGAPDKAASKIKSKLPANAAGKLADRLVDKFSGKLPGKLSSKLPGKFSASFRSDSWRLPRQLHWLEAKLSPTFSWLFYDNSPPEAPTLRSAGTSSPAASSSPCWPSAWAAGRRPPKSPAR